jgi:ribose transport system permease protein
VRRDQDTNGPEIAFSASNDRDQDSGGLRFLARGINFVLPILIVFLAAVTAILEPRFLSASNLENLSRQLVPLTVAAVGQCFVVISGGLDLSIAAVMSLAGVGGILLMNRYGVPVGIGAMIAIGMICGLANGILIGFFRATPLIVTLGTGSIAEAIGLILCHGVPIYDVPESFGGLVGFETVLGIPVTVIIAVAVLAVGWMLLRRTIFGRYVFAIGSNRSATMMSGIDVRFYTMLVYLVAGTTSGIGAIVMTAWVGAAQPVAAPNLTLESIAAIVLGGVALSGGSGGIQHVVLGTLILGTLTNALNMIGISAQYQTLAIGIVIIITVAVDRLRQAAGGTYGI